MTSPSAPVTETTITASDGLATWMRSRNLSIAFTSYQFGELIFAGVAPAGDVRFSRQQLGRTAGMHYKGGRLHLAGAYQLWRIENALRPGEISNGTYDAVFVPRASFIVGDVDLHEVGITADGKPLMVNTKYNCLCTLDPVQSFRPVWMPPFVSDLVGEDRCHLNGLGMDKGRARYVTMLSSDDTLEGWRKRPRAGVLMEVENQRVVTDEVSMPHSPRVTGDGVYLLESGRGMIVRIDPKTGTAEDLAFCPGFLRGFSIVDDHALVTISKPTRADFRPLAIEDELAARGMAAWCGVLVVDLRTGETVEWIRVEGPTNQLFDVIALPGIACPLMLGPEDLRTAISFDRSALPAKRKRSVRQ